MPGRFAAVVLDLDGTLVDSAAELASALNAALGPRGRRPLDVGEVRMMIGEGVIMLTRRALAATGAVPDEDEFARVMADVRHHYDRLPPSATYPGVPETIRALHAAGYALGVCTNKPAAPARRLLGQLGFGTYIRAIAGGDTFPVRKPDPGHVLGLLARLGAAPHEAVMVGDSGTDAEAARGAGLPFVAVGYGYAKGVVAELGADAVVDAFADLPAALARLERR